MTPRLTSSLAASLILVVASSVGAEPDASTPEEPSSEADRGPDDPEAAASKRARDAFLQGTELARKAQWAQALDAFERAQAVKPHPVTTYNIGTCQRAIGAYAQAHLTFQRALREHTEEGQGRLPEALVGQSEAFIAEIERLLVTVELTVVPTGSTLAVDGRPLWVTTVGDARVHWAGVRAPGPGEVVADSRLSLRLDPGAHVFAFSRAGFETALVNQTFAPGSAHALRIELDTLPARLRVDANVPEALVTLDGKEVGPTPLELVRPAGSYQVLVEKDGYEPHRADINLAPGQETSLRAPLTEETTTVFETWWFWTVAGAVVAGGVTATYLLTRPEPEPPPYDGGTIDWVVTPERALLCF